MLWCAWRIITTAIPFFRAGTPYHLAVVFERHRVICWGVNDGAQHAEVNALRRLKNMQSRRKCPRATNKLFIVIVRVRKAAESANLFWSMSMPCVNCAAQLQQSNVGRVSWSTDAGTFKCCKPCNIGTTHRSRAHRERGSAVDSLLN